MMILLNQKRNDFTFIYQQLHLSFREEIVW